MLSTAMTKAHRPSRLSSVPTAPAARARRSRAWVCATAIGIALAAAGPAAADDSAKRGRVVGLQLNTQNSSQHTNFHGSITLRLQNGKTAIYHWGGSTCPGQKLDAAQISVLSMAHLDRARTWLKPYFVVNEGGDKNCLVGFELTA